MLNRSQIMRNAWLNYHHMRSSKLPFSRRFFARCLADAWAGAKASAAWAAEKAGIVRKPAQPVPARSEIDQRIADLSVLPFRFNIAAMEDAIRTEYAAR